MSHPLAGNSTPGHESDPSVELGELLTPAPSRVHEHVRPGARTFRITTEEVGIHTVCRVGMDLDSLIEEELQDYKDGLAFALSRGQTAEDYAASEPDRAIWENGRLLAVLTTKGDGPDVFTPCGSEIANRIARVEQS